MTWMATIASLVKLGMIAFSGNQILFGSEVLATLNGFNTTTLTAANFVSV